MDFLGVLLLILFVLARAVFESSKKKRNFQEKSRRVPGTPQEPVYMDDFFEVNEPHAERPEKKYLKQVKQDKKVKKSPPAVKPAIERVAASDSDDAFRIGLTKNDIRHGIIMSEILLPPRAKRPYGYRKN